VFSDKAIFIVIGIYCTGFAMLGAQFLADSYGITLNAPDGTPIRSAIIDYIRIGTFNAATSTINSVVQPNSTAIDVVVVSIYNAYQLIIQLFLLFTGFYVFNIMSLFGIPAIFIIPIASIYIIMLAILVIDKLRGIG
jgi:hypothetical protein